MSVPSDAARRLLHPLTLSAVACSAVAVASVVVSACGATTVRHERAARPNYLVLHCPKHTVATTDAEAMLEGAWKTIPRVFAMVNRVQGRHEPVSKQNTVIQEVESLDRANSSPRARRWRKTAAKLCGRTTAWHSWAITLLFGESVIADTTGVAFLARSSNRFVIWYAR